MCSHTMQLSAPLPLTNGDLQRAQEVWRNVLTEVGLWPVAQHVADATHWTESSVRAARHAERIAAVGLQTTFAQHAVATRDRDNAQAGRQLKAARDAFREHANSADWKRRVATMNKTLGSPEGKQSLDEARERLVQHIVASDASGEDAREAVAVWDDAMQAISKKKIAGLVEWLDGKLEEGLRARESADLGRKARSPLTTNQWICIAVGTGLGVIGVLACLATPFCNCCYLGWILLAYSAVVAACLLGTR